MDRYIAFDAETGGLETQCSLLTLYIALFDHKLNKLDELDLKIKPNNNAPYVVTAEALSINKIDLTQHNKVAISESEAGQRFREFLWKHSGNGKIKLIPVGHNVVFDEMFIYEHLLGKKEYQKYVSYRHVDTGVIAQFLRIQGKIPNSVTGSLTSLIEHFGLKFKGNAHEADSDTLATVDVLRELLQL